MQLNLLSQLDFCHKVITLRGLIIYDIVSSCFHCLIGMFFSRYEFTNVLSILTTSLLLIFLMSNLDKMAKLNRQKNKTIMGKYRSFA